MIQHRFLKALIAIYKRLQLALVTLVWNARAFVGFMASSMAGKGKRYASYLRKHPQATVGGGNSVHRNPESFGHMTYHTKTVSGFVGQDGVLAHRTSR
jgi:hypothetical protein